MIELTPPENVGLSAGRLRAIADHFNRYVDDGKIPGYLVLIARRGKAAYLHRYGLRDVEAGLPVEEDTIFTYLFNDQAHHLGRRDDAVRARLASVG